MRFLYRQGDLQMLHVWMERMREISPKLWSRMNKKLKILDGVQARVANQFAGREVKDLKREKRRVERELKSEIRELKKKLGIEVPEVEQEEEEEETTDDSDYDEDGTCLFRSHSLRPSHNNQKFPLFLFLSTHHIL